MEEKQSNIPQSQQPDDLDDFIAGLNAEFGKKKKKPEPPHKALNRAFHESNPQLQKSSGKAPERLNPEDSSHWEPVARVTHVVKQCCKTCGDVVSFIGGEYVRFESIMPFGGSILRRSEVCSDLFLYYKTYELEDVVEHHLQEVSRCAGCIQVEAQAQEIWETAVTQHTQKKVEPELVIPGLE